METKVPGWTLADVAKQIGGELRASAEVPIARAVPAGQGDACAITFAESEKYLQVCLDSAVGAVIVWRDAPEFEKPAILVDSPREAFGRLLAMMARPLPLASGIHPSAVVSPEADVHESASVGPFAVVERGAVVARGCQVYPFAYVGEDCRLGPGTVLYPHAVLYRDVTLGERCTVHSGAIVGADGFGFDWDGERQTKVPQVGGVVMGDDVEIGANSCIDRATCGETVVGDGVKLDNLVQVAHNVSVGDHTVMASQVGIGGSSQVGDRVTFGGQAAIADHVTIADEVVLGARSGAFQDIEEAGQYFGLPPLPLPAAMRLMALQQRLPELLSRIKELESKVEELRRSEEL